MDFKIKIWFMLKYYFFLSLVLVAFLFISCRATYTNDEKLDKNDSLIVSQRSILKNYALCKCLLLEYPSDSILRNDGSLNGYIEMGAYGKRAYDLIDSFIKDKSFIKYRSKHKSNLYLMRCLDIYNSKTLDSLIRNLDSYIDTTFSQ